MITAYSQPNFSYHTSHIQHSGVVCKVQGFDKNKITQLSL